jgi:plastocyanin
MRRISVLLLILIVCTAIICGCTVPSASSVQPAATASLPAVQSAAPATNGLVKNVVIRQRSFDPDIITISPGTTVVWTNEDSFNHRVVHLPELPSERELFHSELLSKGDTFSYTFQTPGEFEYGDPQMGSGRAPKVIVK